MAKATDAPKKEKVKKAPKESYLKDNYVVINSHEVSESKVRTSASHIRGIGCIVREEALDAKGNVISVSSTFIPGVKIKTKKDWKYLIIDNGPKSKKGKNAEEEVEEED